MVTNAEAPEVPPTRTERATTGLRIAIGGHPQAAVRRILLWGLAYIGLGVGVFIPAALLVVLVAMTLLALTDQLV